MQAFVFLPQFALLVGILLWFFAHSPLCIQRFRCGGGFWTHFGSTLTVWLRLDLRSSMHAALIFVITQMNREECLLPYLSGLLRRYLERHLRLEA